MSAVVPKEARPAIRPSRRLARGSWDLLSEWTLDAMRRAATNQMPDGFATDTLEVFRVDDHSAMHLAVDDSARELTIFAQAMTGDATVLADPVVFEFEVWDRAWTSGVLLTSVDVWRGNERLALQDALRTAVQFGADTRDSVPLLRAGRHLARAFDRTR